MGVDGAARLFNAENCVGFGGPEMGVGRYLRSRTPHGSEAFALVEEFGPAEDGEVIVSRKKTSRRGGGYDDDSDDDDGYENAGGNVTESRERGKAKGRTAAAAAAANKPSSRLSQATGGGADARPVPNKSTKGKGTTGSAVVSKKEDKTKNMPLFELAALSPAERRVNMQKLRSFLATHGEFPTKYRTLIWRFLLRLPENEEAFSDLARRGTHNTMEHLHDQYPVRSKRVFERLHGVCNQMCHWSEIFGQTSYLPHFAFPFVLVYGQDELQHWRL